MTKIVAALLACLVFVGAHAAEKSATPESITYSLLRSGSTVGGPYDAIEQCLQAREVARTTFALTKTSGTARWVCRMDRVITVTYGSTPICPALPSPEGRTVDCPAGTTGAYTQTRSYTSAPYPTCATLGEWTPATPPAGICVPTEWTFCANEYQTCSFTGTLRVRYGLNSTWIERDLTAVNGGIACRNATFGSDPVPGAAKRCELRSLDTQIAGSATLSWTPPTQNSDGSALTTLAGYRVSYGASATELTQTVQVSNPGASNYTVNDLSPGTYYFTVRAYTSTGTESDQSNTVSKAVP